MALFQVLDVSQCCVTAAPYGGTMENLLAHCSAAIHAGQPILWALFLGGLTGGFTHCLAMCGGFAACRNACAKQGCASVSQKLNLAHHLGRVTTYGFLGLLAALVAKHVAAYAFWPKLEAVMLVIAGVMFIMSSIAGFAHHHRLAGVGDKSAYLRGALLGFMPCGLIYAALMVAATTANPFMGMLGMMLFVLGTLPALWLASLGVELLAHKWRNEMQHVGRVAMALNGVVLLVTAGKLVM